MKNVIVCKLENVVKHPNADRLQIAQVLGNTVIVGTSNFEGELGIYYDDDSKLGEPFAKANDLIPRHDESGKKINSTFFDANLRVRAISLRSVKCDGYWCPISMLAFTGFDLSKLKEHDAFDTLNGHLICEKYITKATRESAGQNQSKKGLKKKSELPQFRKHLETSQFRHDVSKLQVGDYISLSEKIHSTSQRFGYVLNETEEKKYSLNWFLNKLGVKTKPRFEYQHLVGTRNVILENQKSGNSYYGDEGFRYQAVKDLYGRLKKGETLYGEVVSTKNGRAVMVQKTSGIKDKAFQKKYGPEMNYKYSCPDGESHFWVYRITNSNEDGDCVDLSWEAMKVRCTELGLKMVPEVCNSFIFNGDFEQLKQLVESLTEGDSTIDPSHVREGIVIRAERYPQPLVMKSKSFQFKILEGLMKDDSNYEDLEESL